MHTYSVDPTFHVNAAVPSSTAVHIVQQLSMSDAVPASDKHLSWPRQGDRQERQQFSAR
jgi:hypothetical protein